MRRVSRSAALAAVFITVLCPFPEIGGVHLVSSQPTGTDNQNNAPVHYVTKMATKLGLPEPAETHTDDSLVIALRQLMESQRRQTSVLERLAALLPRHKTEETPQKRKTSRPATPPKYPTRNSENSVIMHPEKETPKSISPEPAKTAENNLNSVKTEDEIQVVNNPLSSLQNQSTLHHRTYVRAPNHIVYVPSYSYSPDQDQDSNSHNPQVQVYYSRPGATASNKSPQTSQNLHSKAVDTHIQNPQTNAATVSPPCQHIAKPQTPHSNTASPAPHVQNSHTLQTSHSFKPHPQNSQILQTLLHSNIADPDHISKPQALYSNVGMALQSPNPDIPKTPHTQNSNGLKTFHYSNVVGPAHHFQNPQPLHSNVDRELQSPNPDVLKTPHTHDSQALKNFYYPNIVGSTPHFQNPQDVHSNVVGGTLQSPKPNIAQNPPANFVDMPTQNQNPVILQGLPARFFGNNLQSQEPPIPTGNNPNYVSVAPHSNHPFLPQGFYPHSFSETPQFLHPTSPQGHPALQLQYPYSLHSENMKPITAGQPVFKEYNRNLLVKPFQSDINAHYQKRY